MKDEALALGSNFVEHPAAFRRVLRQPGDVFDPAGFHAGLPPYPAKGCGFVSCAQLRRSCVPAPAPALQPDGSHPSAFFTCGVVVAADLVPLDFKECVETFVPDGVCAGEVLVAAADPQADDAAIAADDALTNAATDNITANIFFILIAPFKLLSFFF